MAGLFPAPQRCSFPGCSNMQYSGGLCHPHYTETRRAYDESDPLAAPAPPEILDPVIMHRVNRFRSIGFNEFQAESLALNRRLDTYDVEALVARGCPIDTAFDIVS